MKNLLLFALLTICFTALGQEAKDTKIVVRTQAKDAKFIGSSMGGSLILIKDADTGELLAKGLTQGSTGKTDLIMKQAKERYVDISEGAAKFETTLKIDKPKFVTIIAKAPVNLKDSRVIAQTQVWLIPGKHMDGAGITLEIPGFVVEGLFPQTHQGFSLEKDKSVELKTNIVMMCGCTTSKGGLWDSEMIEVEANVFINGEFKEVIAMSISEQVNTYTATLDLSEKGSYDVIISAYHPVSKNTGVDQLNFRVSE